MYMVQKYGLITKLLRSSTTCHKGTKALAVAEAVAYDTGRRTICKQTHNICK